LELGFEGWGLEFGVYLEDPPYPLNLLCGVGPGKRLGVRVYRIRERNNEGSGRRVSTFSKSHDGKGANGSQNRPHDAYPDQCRAPGYYESCSERVRVCQLKKYQQLERLARSRERNNEGSGFRAQDVYGECLSMS